jgi:hypothetical protein
LKKVVFVGDRGMLTAARRRDLSGVEGLATISALTHGELGDLIKPKGQKRSPEATR